MKTIQFTVTLNGTGINPYHSLGLERNPFPQLADAKYDQHLWHLAELGATPIKDEAQLREHLKGWSQEFVELCVNKFSPGSMIEFVVEFPV